MATFAARYPRTVRASRQLLFFVKLGAFVHVFHSYVAEVTVFAKADYVAQCMGPSMLPTLNMLGDMVVVEKLTPRWGKLELGDVVVAKSVTNPKRVVCKRILGLPGDRVCVDPTKRYQHYLQVPEGHVWLQGDNFSNSTDSRSYGPVPLALVSGKVVCRIWPEPKMIRNGILEARIEREKLDNLTSSPRAN
ncbi:hypothetical protein RI367_002543 [Sorochytrium milnesiophthora]